MREADDVDREMNSSRINQFRLTRDEIQLGLADVVMDLSMTYRKQRGMWRSGSMRG